MSNPRLGWMFGNGAFNGYSPGGNNQFTEYRESNSSSSSSNNNNNNVRPGTGGQSSQSSQPALVFGHKNVHNFPSAYASGVRLEEDGNLQLGNALCGNHPQSERRPIELYCLQCHTCLCWKCKHTSHNNHEYEEIHATARRAKAHLSSDKTQLKPVIEDILRLWWSQKEDREQMKDKKEAIKSTIEAKYNLLIGMAKRFKQEALDSLEQVDLSIQQPGNKLLNSWTVLDQLHTEMDSCASNRNATQVVLTAGKIYSELEPGRADAHRARDTSCAAHSVASRPTLRCLVSPDLLAEICRNFLGTVIQRDWAKIAPAVQVSQRFLTEKGREQDIYFLMVVSDKIYLSYDVNYATGVEKVPDLFTDAGKELRWPGPSKGKSSFTLLGNGTCDVINFYSNGVTQSYAKSRRGVMLHNSNNGVATIVNTLNDPLASQLEALVQALSVGGRLARSGHEQVSPCGPHRSFDVHPTEPLLVLVEEPTPPSVSTRSVVTFTRGLRGVYESPVLPYQPSDVCFHMLKGRDVLLVADELNDAIHVVDVRTGKFLHYLAPGHPSVVQPTAINVDTRGRLWVACRGGAVLVCEPV